MNKSQQTGFISTASDRDWYFSAKSLVFKWAQIIGPQVFLVHHFIKSQCPERGQESRGISWTEAQSVLRLNKKQIDDCLHILQSVGLLEIDEQGCLIVLDPDDAFVVYSSKTEASNGDK